LGSSIGSDYFRLGSENDVSTSLKEEVVNTVEDMRLASDCNEDQYIVTLTTHKLDTPTPMSDELRPAYRPVIPSSFIILAAADRRDFGVTSKHDYPKT
jgi:hypothetical protein